jgi:hypothetical protein
MTELLVKGFLIDVYGDRGCNELVFHDTLENIYKILDVETIDVAVRKIGNFTYDIICDDEGLLKDSLPSAVTDKDEVQLVGNLLLVNHDEEGNFTSLTDEQIEDLGKHLVMAMMAYRGDTRVYGLLKGVEYV